MENKKIIEEIFNSYEEGNKQVTYAGFNLRMKEALEKALTMKDKEIEESRDFVAHINNHIVEMEIKEGEK